MVVDPATGMPVEEVGGNAQSLGGQYGSTMGQAYGVQMPLYYDAMEAIPPAWATAAWNMGRTRNTILNNKTAQRGIDRSAGVGRAIGSLMPQNRGANAGGLRQTFSPFRMGSLADLSNIDPEMFGTTRKPRVLPTSAKGTTAFAVGSDGVAERTFKRNKTGRGIPIFGGSKNPDGTRTRAGYTPFNFLSSVGNWAAQKTGRVEQGTRAFAPGAFGTMSSMASIASGNYSEARTAKVIGSISRFREAAGMSSSPWLPSSGMPLGINSQRYMSTSLGAARFSNAKYTGRAAGYFEGAQAARTGTFQASKRAIMASDGGGYFGSAVREGAEKFASGSKVARFAGSRSAALGLKAVPFVGQAMLAYDITKFAGKTVGRGLKLGVEGIKSAQGDLIKPGPFGMGYKDNSVAATSRQRGVMAISNSRLNARSFLGQEGAFMYQNFG